MTLQMEKAQQTGGHVADIYLRNKHTENQNLFQIIRENWTHCFCVSLLCDIIHDAMLHHIITLKSSSLKEEK